MVHAATRLLLAYTLACLHVTSAADWELVNLERAVKGSRVLELTGDSLEQAVQDHPLLVVWFYAPWCKQCKLLRDAYEEAASTGVPGVTFGRLDCVKYPKVKQDYGIFSCKLSARPWFCRKRTHSSCYTVWLLLRRPSPQGGAWRSAPLALHGQAADLADDRRGRFRRGGWSVPSARERRHAAVRFARAGRRKGMRARGRQPSAA
eukprot:83840-Prymnesium_polylepis.2